MTTSKKIVLLGHFGVGKTSIIRKFVTNEFSSDYKVTIGVHILKKEVPITNGDDVSLIIWDLEGTDNIDLINKAYLLGTHCFIYVYDISRPLTFSNLEENVLKLKEKFPKTLLKTVANKIDLIDDVNDEKYKDTLQKTDYTSSAKTGENIADLFDSITKALVI